MDIQLCVKGVQEGTLNTALMCSDVEDEGELSVSNHMQMKFSARSLSFVREPY